MFGGKEKSGDGGGGGGDTSAVEGFSEEGTQGVCDRMDGMGWDGMVLLQVQREKTAISHQEYRIESGFRDP